MSETYSCVLASGQNFTDCCTKTGGVLMSNNTTCFTADESKLFSCESFNGPDRATKCRLISKANKMRHGYIGMIFIIMIIVSSAAAWKHDQGVRFDDVKRARLAGRKSVTNFWDETCDISIDCVYKLNNTGVFTIEMKGFGDDKLPTKRGTRKTNLKASKIRYATGTRSVPYDFRQKVNTICAGGRCDETDNAASGYAFCSSRVNDKGEFYPINQACRYDQGAEVSVSISGFYPGPNHYTALANKMQDYLNSQQQYTQVTVGDYGNYENAPCEQWKRDEWAIPAKLWVDVYDNNAVKMQMRVDTAVVYKADTCGLQERLTSAFISQAPYGGPILGELFNIIYC